MSSTITIGEDGNDSPGQIVMIKTGTVTYATDDFGNLTTEILKPILSKSSVGNSEPIEPAYTEDLVIIPAPASANYDWYFHVPMHPNTSDYYEDPATLNSLLINVRHPRNNSNTPNHTLIFQQDAELITRFWNEWGFDQSANPADPTLGALTVDSEEGSPLTNANLNVKTTGTSEPYLEVVKEYVYALDQDSTPEDGFIFDGIVYTAVIPAGDTAVAFSPAWVLASTLSFGYTYANFQITHGANNTFNDRFFKISCWSGSAQFNAGQESADTMWLRQTHNAIGASIAIYATNSPEALTVGQLSPSSSLQQHNDWITYYNGGD